MEPMHLDEIELSHALQGWESPKANRAVTGVPLSIAGQRFDRGVGTHTVGWLGIALQYGLTLWFATVMHYLIANVLAIAVASVSNFLANDRWTFRRD